MTRRARHRKYFPKLPRSERVRRLVVALLFVAGALPSARLYAQCAADSIRNSGGTPCGQHTSGLADINAPTGSASGSPKYELAQKKLRLPKPDFNREIYYSNKLEFSFDAGWLPINIPFPFNVFEGDPYDLYPLRYTLVPMAASLRWHMGNPWGPPVIRGNWDMTFSASYTAIPKGAETHYLSYDMGLRRNFIPRNWRVTPYWDVRAGLGLINAKGPLGVYYAQGQNFTFNINMGAGARYNLSPRYGFSAGLNWMHISNANLSAPAYSNYGINVYGPMFGIDIRLGKHGQNPDQQPLGSK
jgi:hypothetical protein